MYKRVYYFLSLVLATRRERHSSFYANHPQRAAHLVIFKISVGRDPINLITSSTAQIQVSTHWPKLKFSLPPWFNVNSQLTHFSKIFKFSGPSLPVMTSSTLQVHFLSGGLLWQWWLSYPLRTSVRLHPIIMPWTKRLEYFKSLPNWMIKYN